MQHRGFWAWVLGVQISRAGGAGKQSRGAGGAVLGVQVSRAGGSGLGVWGYKRWGPGGAEEQGWGCRVGGTDKQGWWAGGAEEEGWECRAVGPGAGGAQGHMTRQGGFPGGLGLLGLLGGLLGSRGGVGVQRGGLGRGADGARCVAEEERRVRANAREYNEKFQYAVSGVAEGSLGVSSCGSDRFGGAGACVTLQVSRGGGVTAKNRCLSLRKFC